MKAINLSYSSTLLALCALTNVLATSVLLIVPAVAVQHVATLKPVSSGDVTRFASFMAVDGNEVLVSAGRGAFLFERLSADGSSWQQTDHLLSPVNFVAGDVDLRGNKSIIGDTIGGPVAQQSGSARLFNRSNENAPFVSGQRIWPADSAQFDQFGASVALGDGILVVGSDNDSHNGKTSTGSVSIFNEDATSPGNYVELKKFAPLDLDGGDAFGFRLSLSGETLLVGADGQDDAGLNTGAAYIFERNTGGADNWGQVAKLLPPDPLTAQLIGYDVAIDGDIAMVGSLGGIAPGTVHLFERNRGGANQWGFLTELENPFGSTSGDGFGRSVAIQGDLAVVGQLTTEEPEHGFAHVFHRNAGGGDNWGLLATLSAPDANAFQFGIPVEIMGDLVLVGRLGLGFGDDPLGSVFVYRIPEPSSAWLFAIAMLSAIGYRPNARQPNEKNPSHAKAALPGSGMAVMD